MPKQVKEKGHNIDLTNIIVHRINKAAGNKNSVLNLADKELTINLIYHGRSQESINKGDPLCQIVLYNTFQIGE